MKHKPEIKSLFDYLISTKMSVSRARLESLNITITKFHSILGELPALRLQLNTEFRLDTVQLFGGLGRGVVTEESDVDLLLSLKTEYWDEYSSDINGHELVARPKSAIEGVLDLMAELAVELKIRKISVHSIGVTVEIEASGAEPPICIDLIPGLEVCKTLQYKTDYIIPRNYQHWMIANPIKHMAAFAYASEKDENFKHIAHILRFWAKQHNLEIPSFVLDNGLAQLFLVNESILVDGSLDFDIPIQLGAYFTYLKNFFIDSSKSGKIFGWPNIDGYLKDKERILECLDEAIGISAAALIVEKGGNVHGAMFAWLELFNMSPDDFS